MLNGRSAAITLSSSGTFRKSFLWYVSAICMTELAMKTMTADRTIGIHNDVTGTMCTSWRGAPDLRRRFRTIQPPERNPETDDAAEADHAERHGLQIGQVCHE